MKPAQDLCDQSRVNNQNFAQSANLNDDQKLVKVNEAVEHLRLAKMQRDCYNSLRDKIRNGPEIKLHHDTIPVSFSVISFDFCENVHYPSSSQQVGTAYFKIARKCSIFDIKNEKTNIQSNFLIGEADNVGKRAYAVVSCFRLLFIAAEC